MGPGAAPFPVLLPKCLSFPRESTPLSPPEQSPYPSVLDYVRVLRAHRRLIIVVTLGAALAALAYSVAQKPEYTTTASLSLRDESQDLALLGSANAPTLPDVLAAEHASTTRRPEVLNAVASVLHLQPKQVQDEIDVSVEPRTNFVLVAARASKAALASQLANEVVKQDANLSTAAERNRFAAAARSFAAKSRPLSRSKDPTAQAVYADRVSRLVALSSVASPVAVQSLATTPSSPSSPKPVRNVAVGGLSA